MREIKTIGVLTSGGDAPGMNAAIRAVTRAAISNGWKVKAIFRGYEGLINNEIKDFTTESVSNTIQRGGTILKTARSKDFMTPEGRKKAHANMRSHGIDALIVIGGNGSLAGAQAFAREFDMPCKTEDFDGDFECVEGNDGTYAIVYNNDVVVMFNYHDKGEKNQYSYMYSIYEQGVFVDDIFSFENYNPNMSVEELFHAFGRPSKVGMIDNKIYLIEYVIEDFRIRFHITNKDNNSYTYMITCFVK